MIKIEFIKCHGSSNDFILIDEIKKDYGFSELERKKLAIQLCERKESIGADGLLFFQKSKLQDARMRMFNPDGTEAEMCGNGVRCIGRYAQDMLQKKSVSIETMKGIQEIIQEKELAKSVRTFSVSLMPVSIELKDIPLNLDGENCIERTIEGLPDIKFSAVSMGNPHLISFVEKMDIALLREMGKKVNQIKTIFPEGMNLSFCQPIATNKLYVMTYERGLGITKACGTGMSASSVVASILDYCKEGEWIEIYNTGGLTMCKVSRKAQTIKVQLKGNATFEYKAELSIDNPAGMQLIEEYEVEREAYRQVIDVAERELAGIDFSVFKRVKI